MLVSGRIELQQEELVLSWDEDDMACHLSKALLRS
jgi:hypothetical protein